MRQKPNWIWPLVFLLALMTGVIGFWYGDILSHPNDFVFHPDGDGLKNYYSPWYHVKHDSCYQWFEGMNYPYGDHPTFADGQPLISNSLRFISHNITDISDHTIGILNVLMLLSPLLTAIFLFLILWRLGLNGWYAMFGGVCIALLSPQLLRAPGGHYALAYSFWFPLFWYLAMRAWENRSWLWDILLAVCLYLSAWVHPYFLMIGAVFLGLAWVVRVFLFPSAKGMWLRQIIQFLLHTAVPLIAFRMVLNMASGGLADRPESPYGFEEYYASWRTIFLPMPIPGMSWFGQFLRPMEASWEGIAYVGALGSLMVLVWLKETARRFLRKRRPNSPKKPWRRRMARWLAPTRNKFLAVSILAAIGVLIFAFGFPFSIKPEKMTELFPPIKQFRSTGRFAWVFYYVWSVYGFYWIFLLRRRLNMGGKRLLGWFVMLPIALFAVEAFSYQYSIQSKIAYATLVHQRDRREMQPTLDMLEKVKVADYDAILVLPYVHGGSENFFASDPSSVSHLFPSAMATHLPLMDGSMSRTSINRTWKMMQWLGEPLGEPEILADLPQKGRILILHTGGKGLFDGCSILKNRQPIAQQGSVRLYDLPFSDLRNHDWKPCQSLPDTSGWIASHLLPWVSTNQVDPDLYLETFETGEVEGFMGGKAAKLSRRDNHFYFDRPMGAAKGDTLIVSLWAMLRGDRLPVTYLGVMEKDAAGNDVLWQYDSMSGYIKAMGKDWAMVEMKVPVLSEKGKLTLNITHWGGNPEWIIVDDLMVRNGKTDVVEERKGWVWVNNFPVKRIEI